MLRVKQSSDIWYFSNGLFTEHTQALYKLKENELTIVDIRYLPQVIRYLRRNLKIDKVVLRWLGRNEHG